MAGSIRAVAPLPVINDVYRVALEWFNIESNANATNVMHFRKSGSNPAALYASLDANVTDLMWSCQGSHSDIVSVA